MQLDQAAVAADAAAGGAVSAAGEILTAAGAAAAAEDEDEEEDGSLDMGTVGDDVNASSHEALMPALELLHTVVLRRWPKTHALPRVACTEVLPALLTVVSHATQPSVLRDGCLCLGQFAQRGALADGTTLRMHWLDTALRNLRGELTEAAVASGGVPLLTGIVRYAPSAFAERADALLWALVQWLRSATRMGLRHAILVVLAKIALAPPPLGCGMLVDALQRLGAHEGTHEGAHGGALPLVLSAWIETAPDVRELSATECLLVHLSATECHRVPPNATECHRVPPSATESPPHQVLHPNEALMASDDTLD